MNYGWRDEVGEGGGGVGGGCLARACAPLTGKLLLGRVT